MGTMLVEDYANIVSFLVFIRSSIKNVITVCMFTWLHSLYMVATF